MVEPNFGLDLSGPSSLDEQRLIPHLKRFMECAIGDAEFRATVQENPAGSHSLLRARGILGVDPVQAVALIPDGADMALAKVPTAELPVKPQAELWLRHVSAKVLRREASIRRAAQTPDVRFNAWRQRQVNRCNSQLSSMSNRIVLHAVVAYELSKGCSIGCTFCGISAERLQAVFLYTEENARLWQDVLSIAVARFGNAAGGGSGYWATDPSDNPDYFKFMKDFGRATGNYPAATTAAPTRNLDWTRESLRFRQEHLPGVDRFSILSTNVLRRVHKIFSAEELANTELIFQNREALVQLSARSGRNRANAVSGPVQDHTIACVSGYLINMVERSVQLISPCPPSDRWPLGYRIHASGSFSRAAELDQFIQKTFEDDMPLRLAPDDILAFRRDLLLSLLPDGFALRSAHVTHRITGSPQLAELGRLIAKAELTGRQVIDELRHAQIEEAAISSSIQRLFDESLLEDGLSE
jgi:radical SAM family RiPP maturation amino acid epimerase